MLSGRFVIGWNTPGYLPDMEVIPCDSFAEAKAALAEAMRRFAHDGAQMADSLLYAAAMVEDWTLAQLDMHGECAVRVPFDFDYWVRRQPK